MGFIEMHPAAIPLGANRTSGHALNTPKADIPDAVQYLSRRATNIPPSGCVLKSFGRYLYSVPSGRSSNASRPRFCAWPP
jgi:hypothetical protein